MSNGAKIGSSKKQWDELRKKNRYSSIIGHHLNIIISCNLKPVSKMLLLHIINETAGYNRMSVYFDVDDLSAKIGSHRRWILKSIDDLEERGIIKRGGNGINQKSRGLITLEPHHQLWRLDMVGVVEVEDEVIDDDGEVNDILDEMDRQ